MKKPIGRKSDPVIRKVRRLTTPQLRAITLIAVEMFYKDRDGWNADKEVNGGDLVEVVGGVLEDLGITAVVAKQTKS